MRATRTSKAETNTQATRSILGQKSREPSAAPEYSPLTAVASRIDASPSAQAHASLLNRAVDSKLSRRSGSLLHLQRQYGNRHVQRVLAIARQGSASQEVAPEVESSIESKLGGGQSLNQGARDKMEPAFGVDFSGVRVHTDAQADTLNRALSARAFTTGRDIFFRRGEYNPSSSSGRELLAHELTHVVQQGAGRIQGKLSVSRPGDPDERQADQVAKEVLQQQSGNRHENSSAAEQAPGSDIAALAAADPQKLPDGEIVFGPGGMRYKNPSIQNQVQSKPYTPSINHPGTPSLLQLVGECDGRKGQNCTGRCEPRAGAGKRGVCQWGGVTHGCKCRDQSKDEPPPSGTTATAEPGTLANPIVYSEMKSRNWRWSLVDEDLIYDDTAARFQVFANFGKTTWGSGVAWVLDEVNASRQTITGLSGEVHDLSSRYFVINGQLVFTLRIQLRFKTADIKETSQTGVGLSLSTSDKASIGASAPAQGGNVSAGAEKSRGAGLNLSKTWGSERILAGSTFDVTRDFKFTNNGSYCNSELTSSFDPESDLIGDIPSMEVLGSPNWSIRSNDPFFAFIII